MVESAHHKCWPLIAATAAVDSLAGVWWAIAQPAWWENRFVVASLTALAMGQVAIVAIWLAFRRDHDAWSYIAPITVLAFAAVVRLKLQTFGEFTIVDYACRSGVQMLGTLVGLWALQISIWRWWFAVRSPTKWEFSLRQMLVWTTTTALFLALVGRSTWSNGELVPLTAWSGIFAPPVIAIGVVVAARHLNRWYVRLCAYVVVGAFVAAFVAYGRSFILLQLNFEFILEALIIAVWVEWGDILPRQLPAMPAALSTAS